ncbi:MAG: SRPBCC family protein, partial [Gemmatimonadota bacterium]|nr:SRPBCC family protein [Gemmatimonadota bacterium]
MNTSPFSIGVKILGAGAVLLSTFLLIGFLLPGTWESEASLLVPSTADEVLAFLDSPEGWQEWTPWPEVGVERSGPESGAGAQLAWDDPELGSGSFTLGATRPERVEYSVEVGEGAMHATGAVTLTPENGSVRVLWQEMGDLGNNPLMGY